jgi:hypothetical protein
MRLTSEAWCLAGAQCHRYLDLLNTFPLRTHCSVSITVRPASAHLHIKEDLILTLGPDERAYCPNHLLVTAFCVASRNRPLLVQLGSPPTFAATYLGWLNCIYVSSRFLFLWHHLIITRTPACRGRHPFKCSSEFHELCDIHVKIQVHTRSHQKKQSWSRLLHL